MAGKWSTYEIRIAASFRSTNPYRARDINAKLEKAARDVCVSHPLLIAPTNYFRRRRRCRCRKETAVKDAVFPYASGDFEERLTLKNRTCARISLDSPSLREIRPDAP